jgi:hypothetical protein
MVRRQNKISFATNYTKVTNKKNKKSVLICGVLIGAIGVIRGHP